MLESSSRVLARPELAAFVRSSARVRLAALGLVVPAIVSTVALPAYAQTDRAEDAVAAARISAVQYEQAVTEARAQTYETPEVPIETASLERDEWGATSAAEVSAQLRAASYVAPLTDPPAQPYSGAQVIAIAQQYYGAPYAFGGASPAGFDCSGFTMYVFAQVGISLPHGYQGGYTRIAASAAQPGDLVILDGGSHVGIYAGGGMMIDAPYAGKTVGLHAIYNGTAYFVRPGI